MLVSAKQMSKKPAADLRSFNFAPSGHHEAPVSGSKEMDLVLAWKGSTSMTKKPTGQMHCSHSCNCPYLLLILYDYRHRKVALHKQ